MRMMKKRDYFRRTIHSPIRIDDKCLTEILFLRKFQIDIRCKLWYDQWLDECVLFMCILLK